MSLSYYKLAVILDKDAGGQNGAPNQAVAIYKPDGVTLATIYSDEAGTIPIAQPGATTDAEGNFEFYALDGEYVAKSGTFELPIFIGTDANSKTFATLADAIAYDGFSPDGINKGRIQGVADIFVIDNNEIGAFPASDDCYLELISSRGPKDFGLEIIAHRGFTDQFPQNTMLAMSSAIYGGASSLECDVQVSSDGELYLFHDVTVDNLTNGTGTFTELTSAYIDSLEFTKLSGTAFESERIPKFSEFLEYARSNGIYIYPEIKDYRTYADIDLVIQAIADAAMIDLCAVQSFRLSDLERVRELSKNITVCHTISWPTTSHVDALAPLGKAVMACYREGIKAQPEVVEYARQRGIDVIAWVSEELIDVQEVMKLGVNRIMSDVLIRS